MILKDIWAWVKLINRYSLGSNSSLRKAKHKLKPRGTELEPDPDIKCLEDFKKFINKGK